MVNKGHPGKEEGGGLRISPLFNDAFLKVFGSQDSKRVAQSLVNAILRLAGIEQIGEVEQISADAASPGGIAAKSPHVGALVVTDEGEPVDLEAERHTVNADNKPVSNACRLLGGHVPRGRQGPRRDAGGCGDCAA